MILVVVESPAKCKKIQGYLGKGYVVKASFGHIRDLSPNRLGVDISDKYKPTYAIIQSKRKIYNELRLLAKKAKHIILATDKDREGEAIAWHLQVCLSDTYDKKFGRVTFNSITKTAIVEAFKHPSTLDEDEVRAQEARRVLDRLLGFGLCRIVRSNLGTNNLTAGRVQSVIAALIHRKEQERLRYITAYNTQSTFIVDGKFKSMGHGFRAQHTKKYKTKDSVLKFMNSIIGASFKIEDTKHEDVKKYPPPPYITSTLQIDAQKNGFNAKSCMQVAQKLYEGGLITYMRTDSPTMSISAINMFKKMITTTYGEDYSAPRSYVGRKSKTAQDAHECIRVTDANLHTIDASPREQVLYGLIRRRSIASQMSPEEVLVTKISITHSFVVSESSQSFDGYRILYPATKTLVSMNLRKNDVVTNQSVVATQQTTPPPPLYNEGTLIQDLERLGVGRPSTYASMVNLVQARGYVALRKNDTVLETKVVVLTLIQKKKETTETTKDVVLGKQGGRVLCMQPNGVLVIEFLEKYFNEITQPVFTSKMEKVLDKVSDGKITYHKAVDTFYVPYDEAVKSLPKTKRVPTQDVLGTLEGGEVVLKNGKFGPYVTYKGKLYSMKETTELSFEEAVRRIKTQPTTNAMVLTFRKIKFTIRKSKFLEGSYYVQFKYKGKSINKPLPKTTKIDDVSGKTLYETFCC